MPPLSIEPGLPESHGVTIPLGHKRYHYLKKLVLLLQFFSLYKMPIEMNMLVFLLGKCQCSDRRNYHAGVVDRKSQRALALLYLAAECCELRRCADRVRGRIDNKDEVLGGKFSNFGTFRLPPKRQLSILN